MRKLRAMTVVGTRPEIIRLSRVIYKLDTYCDHVLIHSGQNYDYELNEVFFQELEIRKPDEFLNAAAATPAATIANVIARADEAIEKHRPDALLLLGDTNSCLAAIAGKRRKVPIFHMEAGNRCFDFRVPEEINRRIVDHIADINLTYSQIAREYLLKEGLPADQVIKIGSPMREVLNHYALKIASSDILQRLQLISQKYFLVSSHREENVDAPSSLVKLIDLLNGISEEYGYPVIVSTHPRTASRIAALGDQVSSHPLVQFKKPFGFFDYVKLQCEATCVLSDSGTITEESSIMNFPAISLREVHERPEGFEEAAVMFVGLDAHRALQALEIMKKQSRGSERTLQMVSDYRTDNVSEKVVRIIQSYTPFVNRRVWLKHGA